MNSDLKLLMSMMDSPTEDVLWEKAPDWANYAVEVVCYPRVGFISNLGTADKIQMLDRFDGWDRIRHNDESEWNMEDVVSARPQRHIELNFSGEKSIHCEISSTIVVLNDPGHSEAIVEEFKFHLSMLLEMQRERLSAPPYP
jgi:hypothetical protein